jgi:uncharacterized protein YbjT (DUF2867 family)
LSIDEQLSSENTAVVAMWSPAERGSIPEVRMCALRRSTMTSPHTHRDRVYRRCASRHAGKQLGARCPELTSIPAFGAIRLEKLNHLHVARFIDDQLAAGRGPTTIQRLVATLSSALGDAVRQRRLQHNPARYL